MRYRIYLRLARNLSSPRGFKVDASVEPKWRPLVVNPGAYGERELHTVHFAVDVDVPPEMLNPKTAIPLAGLVVVDPEQAAIIEAEQADLPTTEDSDDATP